MFADSHPTERAQAILEHKRALTLARSGTQGKKNPVAHMHGGRVTPPTVRGRRRFDIDAQRKQAREEMEARYRAKLDHKAQMRSMGGKVTPRDGVAGIFDPSGPLA